VVEHSSYKGNVAGSNPAIQKNKILKNIKRGRYFLIKSKQEVKWKKKKEK
jgi:hypothetical protein